MCWRCSDDNGNVVEEFRIEVYFAISCRTINKSLSRYKDLHREYNLAAISGYAHIRGSSSSQGSFNSVHVGIRVRYTPVKLLYASICDGNVKSSGCSRIFSHSTSFATLAVWLLELNENDASFIKGTLIFERNEMMSRYRLYFSLSGSLFIIMIASGENTGFSEQTEETVETLRPLYRGIYNVHEEKV